MENCGIQMQTYAQRAGSLTTERNAFSLMCGKIEISYCVEATQFF